MRFKKKLKIVKMLMPIWHCQIYLRKEFLISSLVYSVGMSLDSERLSDTQMVSNWFS